MSPWREWGECSLGCGGGAKNRLRQITRLPQGRGAKCPHLSDSKECNTASCATLVATLVLSSTGRAAEHYGGWLGEYQLIEGVSSDGRPMYRQRDDVANPFNLPTQAKNSETFLYYKANCSDERRNDPTPGWMVGSGDCKFGLKSSTDTAIPPVTGWQFWSTTFGGRKRDDPSLKLESGSLEPCSRVDVAARGEAAEILQSRLGSYYPEGRWSQGRPIYRFKGDKEINYLRVAPGAAFWTLMDSPTSRGAYLQGGKGTLSPGDPAAGPNLKSGLEGWNYYTGKEWEDSGSRVTVSCPTGESHSRVRQITRKTQGQVAKCPHFSDSRECNTASCATLVLSSTEKAAEFHGRYLGEWMLVQGACSDGRPV